MPSKNDLSALKTAHQKPAILPSNDEAGSIKPKRGPITGNPVQVGRPKKAKSEKRSYKITLSLTEAEGANVAEKAGLAGEATYLYAALKEAGVFDK